MNILNKITSVAAICILTFSFAGCNDYLDVSNEIAENLTLEEVFDNPDYAAAGMGICLTVSLNIPVSVKTNTTASPVFGFLWVAKPQSAGSDLLK